MGPSTACLRQPLSIPTVRAELHKAVRSVFVDAVSWYDKAGE